MQSLIDLVVGLIVLLAAAVLSLFGVNAHAPRQADREVHRVTDCRETTPPDAMIVESGRNC